MSIVKEKFGMTKDGKEISLYRMKNKNGMEVTVTDLGAVIVNIMVADREGKFEDVVLGFKEASEYEVNGPSFGAPVGRVANRIANAAFTLNGKEYTLDQNNGKNCLHSGNDRSYRKFCEAEVEEGIDEDSVCFSRVYADGEQGYPGNLTMSITYCLNDANELLIHYEGVSDEDTIIGMTNHSYFNIGKGGHKCPDIFKQEVKIETDEYTVTDDGLIPTGEIGKVTGTPLDFTSFKEIGKDMKTPGFPQAQRGYDDNYVFGTKEGDIVLNATIRDQETGRQMEVLSDFPGMQFYTAATLNQEGGKEGMTYGNYSAACFETQNYPNAINVSSFPSSVLKAGEKYDRTTIYRFSVF